MLGDDYSPQTIEEADQDEMIMSGEMTQTQHSTQEEATTTNIIEESPGTASDNGTPFSQDETTTANVEIETTGRVEIQTTESTEIPTTVQSWLSTSINENEDEDTTKEANGKVFTDQTTTDVIWDFGYDIDPEELEVTTVKSLNKLLWNTLVEEQEKEKPANYNGQNRKYRELYYDEEKSQEEKRQAVDIKERKYNIKEEEENIDNNRNIKDEESENNREVQNNEDREGNGGEEDYEDFDDSREDYQYDDNDTSNIFIISYLYFK